MTDPPLGPRAAQILGLVLEGLTDAEIGERLSLAASSVQHYRRDMLAAAGVPSTPKFLAKIHGEQLAAALAEIERLTRELALLRRRVNEADERRSGRERRGVIEAE